MSSVARIERLTAQIQKLDDKSASLQAKAFGLRTQREELISQIILEDEVLSDTSWELRLSGDSSPYLEYSGAIDASPMKDIIKLSRTDWHSWLELSDGIRLQFDNDDVSLNFKEGKQLMPFIKKQKLKITGTGISDKLAKLKREVAALEDICHQFSL